MDIRAVKFRVAQSWRIGALYSPALEGRQPAALLLHGFPGVQKNDDIAAELCRRGIAAFVPYSRGSWGSDGEFSVDGLIVDARAALRLLRRYRHVDPERVGILGLSVGGWTALRLAAEAAPAAVCAMAPAVPGLGAGDPKYVRKNARVIHMGDPRAAWDAYGRNAREQGPQTYVPRIAPAPLLFVQGSRDRMVPPASTRTLFAMAGQPKELVELGREDHDFETDRPAVVRLLCDWFAKRLGARPAQTPASV